MFLHEFPAYFTKFGRGMPVRRRIRLQRQLDLKQVGLRRVLRIPGEGAYVPSHHLLHTKALGWRQTLVRVDRDRNLRVTFDQFKLLRSEARQVITVLDR